MEVANYGDVILSLSFNMNQKTDSFLGLGWTQDLLPEMPSASRHPGRMQERPQILRADPIGSAHPANMISAGTENSCRGNGLIVRKCSKAGGKCGLPGGLGLHADPDPRRPGGVAV